MKSLKTCILLIFCLKFYKTKQNSQKFINYKENNTIVNYIKLKLILDKIKTTKDYY